jgi:hypothetical protein
MEDGAQMRRCAPYNFFIFVVRHVVSHPIASSYTLDQVVGCAAHHLRTDQSERKIEAKRKAAPRNTGAPVEIHARSCGDETLRNLRFLADRLSTLASTRSSPAMLVPGRIRYARMKCS